MASLAVYCTLCFQKRSSGKRRTSGFDRKEAAEDAITINKKKLQIDDCLLESTANNNSNSNSKSSSIS